MKALPEHIQEELHRLIREGLPAEQIAFMMRLSRETVESEMSRINNPDNTPSPTRR